MKKIKIAHCGGYIMTREELEAIKIENEETRKRIAESKSKSFIGLQGETQVCGYLLVVQALTKKYKNLQPIAVSKTFSLYAI